MDIQTISPNTNIALKSFEEMNDQAVDAAVSQAVKAFNDWKKLLTNNGPIYYAGLLNR